MGTHFSTPNDDVDHRSWILSLERLIALVESTQGAVFIRNGAEHTAKDAADHLLLKWKAAGSNIRTAKQFVEHIATKSSISGEPYQIRLADGSVVLTGDYLSAQLSEIEHVVKH